MINGIKVKLSVDALRSHLMQRVAHHGAKGTWFAQKADEIDRATNTPEPSISRNPASDLRSRAETHATLSHYFKFLADNLATDPDGYLLDKRELEELEFISQRYIQ